MYLLFNKLNIFFLTKDSIVTKELTVNIQCATVIIAFVPHNGCISRVPNNLAKNAKQIFVLYL